MTVRFAAALSGLTALVMSAALGSAGCSSQASTAGTAGSGGSGGQAASTTGPSSNSSTATGAGGCSAIPEDCLNGLDDDCDGAIDCDDADSCGDYECVPLPAGGLLVEPVALPGDCPSEVMSVALADCSQCGCQVDDPGSCTHVAHLYTSAGCMGTPNESITVTPGNNCTPANTTAANGDTVSVMAEPVGAGDASCSVTTATAPLTPRYLCVLPNPSMCRGGDACAPQGSLSCVLFDGDVACPEGYGNKEIIYATVLAECDCACDVTSQACPASANTHLHAHNNSGCPGGPDEADALSDGSCLNTAFSAVQSLDNHDADLAADSATCGGTGGPTIQNDAQTVCCPP